MMILAKTPLRVSLFGGGTDYPSYLDNNDGIVIGSAINKFNYVYLNNRPLNNESEYRLNYSIRESVKGLSDIQHNSIRECFRYFNIMPPFELHSLAELPARTGLGSSSAFTVGLLNALCALQGEPTNSRKLAEMAHVIEIEKIGENVGLQDQILAALGGFNIVEFKNGSFYTSNDEINADTIQILQDHMMLFYLGSQRSATEILEEQITRNLERKNDKALAIMTDIAREAAGIIRARKPESPVKEIATLLRESWRLKKELSSKVSNPIVDETYEKAIQNGAMSGKLLGAGKTGMMLFLAPPEDQQRIEQALHPIKRINFQFCEEGSKIIS